MSGRLLCFGLLALFAGVCRAEATSQHVVDRGIGVDFTASRPTHPGDGVSFQFDVKDTASGAPMTGLRPAAWLALRGAGDAAPNCARQVATFLGGDLFNRAEVDLNSYFVLALNDDASVSVVDPLFGFGGSKLLAMLPLRSPGADWALSSSQDRLFVSMPASDRVAVADTRQWRTENNVATGTNPRRVLALGPRIWVGDDQGLTAIDAKTLATTPIPFGASGDVVASDDGDFIFATSANKIVIVDAHLNRVLARVDVDGAPSILDYSAAAKAAYALDARTGNVFVVDARRRTLVATLQVRAGATHLRFAPDGRHALIANPMENVVQVLDAATNRIVQTAEVSGGPDRISYTSLLAYVRRRASEVVTMIPLEQVGVEGRRIGVADFPGGRHSMGDMGRSLADSIVIAPEGPAVLVANAADKMIYLYKEGMAAPLGGFSTYGQTPRAVLVVDHGLREEHRGRYATAVPVKKPGIYDVVLFVDAPRVVACFDLAVAGDSQRAPQAFTSVTAIDPPKQLIAGAAAHLRFALRATDGKGADRADDVRALAFEAPGVWQQRGDMKRLYDDSYEFDFVPPERGTYYVWIESESLGLARNNSQFQIYEAN